MLASAGRAPADHASDRAGRSSAAHGDQSAKREQLASLGTMAAGLAHELNNPAAAAQRRGAAIWSTPWRPSSGTLGAFVEAGIAREDAARLVELQRQGARARRPAQAGSSTGRAPTREDAMLELARGPRRARGLAARGAARGRRPGRRLAARDRDGSPARRPTAALRLGGRDRSPRATSPASCSTGPSGCARWSARSRIRLHGPGAAAVEADLHEGLESTLTILGHKLKHTEIAVVRDYDPALPPLTVRGSELNQVWTNLLDNAIDALGEQRHDHHRHRAREATPSRSRSPTTAPASPRPTRGGCSSRSSPRRPGRGHRPGPRDDLPHRGRATTTATSRWSRDPATRASPSDCRSMAERKPVPRDRDDDYTREAADARRRFAEEQTGASLEHVGRLLVRARRDLGQHRALHRRGAGAARPGRPGEGPRRARAGRLLRADGHRRGHARRLLQPRHAAALRGRRRQDHDPRRPHAARARVPVRRARARCATSATGSTRTTRTIKAAAEATTSVRQAARHRAVSGEPDPLHALQLHDRRRRRPEPDGQGHPGRLPLDRREQPRRSSTSSSSRTSPPTRRARR